MVLAGSEVGDLQTIFYLALVGAVILGLALFLLAVGFSQLPGFFKEPGHRLLASLVTGAFTAALVFIAAVSGALFYAVGHRG
jgi:hypothetical protein